MRKKFGIILCICLFAGMASGCGAEESNLSNSVTVSESLAAKNDFAEGESTADSEENYSTETVDAARSGAEQLDWKQAYLAKAEEIRAEGHPLKYDLIYLDADDIPELVAARSNGGFHLYTLKDGEVCELMNCAGLGDGVYRYEPYQGIIIKEINATGQIIYFNVAEDLESTEKEPSDITGDWQIIMGRYNLGTFRSLLEETDNLWEQKEWAEEEWEKGEWEQEELVLEGLDRKTLKIIQYTDADGNEFYITEEKALQEAAALLGGLRGVPSTWEPDFWHKNQHNYCIISFTTIDGRWDSVVYEGNNLQRSIGDNSFRMQDDFEEVIAGLLNFTSTDYLLSQVESGKEQQIIQGILEEEDSQLVYLVVNRLEDLNYCLFETSAGKGMEFHLLLWGSWEDKEVQQHQIFSLNEEEGSPLDQLSAWCEVTKEDMDFDGRPDLLIYEGQSHDIKNGFMHYRVMRWDESQGQFTYYPSFPFWITWLNLEDKQVFYKAKGGMSDRTVQIYEVVEGQYRVVQEMILSTEFVPKEYEGKTYTHSLEILSYYENGELVWKCDVSGMNWDEMEELCRQEGLSEIFSYVRDYG